MQTIQIDGTYTYADNIKTLKIGDQIRLIPNPNNRINSEAIGAYTLNGRKIGYVPFKSNQIDINAKYNVIKISLTQDNPQLIISRQFDNSNFIHSEPSILLPKYNNKIIKTDFDSDLKSFSNFLKRSGVNLINLGLTYLDSNYQNLLIETSEGSTIFYTVTKKFYEENVFKYDEFYKFGLIPKCIYQPYQIHRLEIYLEKNYKPIDKLLKMKKLKFSNLVEQNIFDNFDKINENNFGFEKIESDNLVLLNKLKLSDSEIKINYVNLLIKKTISNNQLYDSNKYLELNNIFLPVKSQSDTTFDSNLDYFKNIFNNIKVCNLAYNHEIKSYCNIDFYDDINIVEISNNLSINKEKFIELLLKIVITNKQVINIYNPLKGVLLRLEVPQIISNQIFNLIYKPKK
jgi:hypothetical protein